MINYSRRWLLLLFPLLFNACNHNQAVHQASDPSKETSWTARAAYDTAAHGCLAWGNNLFIVAGKEHTLTSADGKSWATHENNLLSPVSSVAYGNGLFAGVVKDSNGIYTSSDGITWTKQLGGGKVSFCSIVWNGNQFLALAKAPLTDGYHFIVYGYTAYAFTSTDGLNWASDTIAAFETPVCIAWGAGRYLEFGKGDSPDEHISTDGKVWNNAPTQGLSVTSVVSGNGSFIALSPPALYYSSDTGRRWQATLWYGATYNALLWDGARFIAGGDSVAVSHDGKTWVSQAYVPHSPILQMAAGGGVDVALSQDAILSFP